MAWAATLSFVPASGSYSVGSTFTIGVFAGSGSTAINAVSGVVSFPREALEVVSVSKNQSIVSLWVQEPTFSNTAGTVNFEGIILNPGFSGTSGRIVNVTFRVKVAGTADLSFSVGSILANDGSGTEILSSKEVARYQNEETSVVPNSSSGSTVEVIGIIPADRSAIKAKLISASHPVDGWSNKTSGTFEFVLTDEVISMRLLVDNKPDSIPVVVYTPPLVSRTIDDLIEGVSYLHVQYKDVDGWGEVLHHRLQIDTVLPENFTVKAFDTDLFLLKADDKSAGISYHEVQIDGGETTKIDESSPLYRATNLAVGEHTLLAKVFDRAGNFVTTTLSFSIPDNSSDLASEADEKESIEHSNYLLSNGAVLITVLSIVIPSLALLMLTGFLLFLSWRFFGGFKKKLEKEIYEARTMVYKSFTLLKADLEVDINTLEKASAKRKLTREELKILKRLQKNIDTVEQLIIKEVTDIETKIGL